MNTLQKICLLVISLLSFYIIASVGLEIMPKFFTSNNEININNVALNLSYSYFAGLIFYFFISYLPERIQLQKTIPILKFKMDRINSQIESYIHTFNSGFNDGVIKTITDAEIQTLFLTKSLMNKSYYSFLTGDESMLNVDFINLTKKKIVDYVDGILLYKEFLNFDQIVALEEIKGHKFFQLFVIQDKQHAILVYNQIGFKKDCANEFCELVKTLRKIKF
jgi:hypothetical protein